MSLSNTPLGWNIQNPILQILEVHLSITKAEWQSNTKREQKRLFPSTGPPPQTPKAVPAGTGQRWISEATSGTPAWVEGTHVLGPSSAASLAQEQEVEPKAQPGLYPATITGYRGQAAAESPRPQCLPWDFSSQ